MIAIHKSLRREFGLLPGLVGAVEAGGIGRARQLTAHLTMELQQLHDHHAAEDAVLWPELLDTGRADADLVAEMENQHQELAHGIETLRPALTTWSATARITDRDVLAGELLRLSALLESHLDIEERSVLPLVREYLTTEDWNALRAESARRVPKDPRVAFRLVGGLLESADAHERDVLLDQMPPPLRWYVTGLGARSYSRYVRRIRSSTAR